MSDRLPDLTRDMVDAALRRGFLHFVRAKAQATPEAFAQMSAELGERHVFMQRWQKAAVGTTTGDAAAASLQAELARAFLDAPLVTSLRRQIPFLSLPPHVQAPIASTSATARFIAAGAGIPVTRFDLTSAFLGGSKIAIIATFSDDFVRRGGESTLTLLERHLARLVAEAEDEHLLDAQAAVADERPAGLLFGLSPVTTGSPDTIVDAIAAVYAAVRDGKATRPYFILSPRAVLHLATHASPVFRDLPRSIGGVPVATSAAAGAHLICLDADAIGLHDGGLDVDRARHAALQFDTEPTQSGATPTATTLVSLWQTNTIALRLQRWIDWVPGYADAVAYATIGDLAGSPS